jgi:hypothetical protein
MDNKNDKIYKNLITILKLFQSRPYHLAKYLMENEALREDFLEKIKNSERLNKINEGESDSSIKAIYFIDISHMKDFFNSLTDDKYDKNTIDKRDITTDLNRKLDRCIREERYEDAIRIRDYMEKNNIERKKDNL